MNSDRNSNRDNYILIGMPASGKSTVGVILAKIIGYNFVDTDIVIQSRARKRLSDIIDQEGVDYFLEFENKVNASVNVSRSVIATGGSAVYGEEAMEHFRGIGKVIYLQSSYETIRHRLHDIHQRGVVLKEGQTFQDLYRERVALYEKYADIVISEHQSIEDTVTEILERVRSGRSE